MVVISLCYRNCEVYMKVHMLTKFISIVLHVRKSKEVLIYKICW